MNEVRFALDSVFIGPSSDRRCSCSSRATTRRHLYRRHVNELQDFFSDEGPRLLRDGGRLAVKNNILPVVASFTRMAEGARRPANIRELPDGFRTARVRRSLDDLSDQIKELRRLVKPVQRDLPPAEISGGRLMAIPSRGDRPPVSCRQGTVGVSHPREYRQRDYHWSDDPAFRRHNWILASVTAVTEHPETRDDVHRDAEVYGRPTKGNAADHRRQSGPDFGSIG